MTIGSLKEVKRHEYRVGITPSCAKAYIKAGHTVLIEKDAGVNAGYENEDYETVGARIIDNPKDICDKAEMIVKVKEPQPQEYDLFHQDQILFTYLHLAADASLTTELAKRNIKGIAYETIETAGGELPLLKPMSEIAGRLSVQEGAKYLEKPFGGSGVLLGGVPGTERGKVAILGAGTVGTNAAKIAVGIGADVTILDISPRRLEHLDDIFYSRITTLYSNDRNIEKIVEESDLIIGAVLLPGAKAPWLIKREHLKAMKKGSVIVDVAVDQGGCVETTRPTTHDDPTFIIDDVIHYCVANMPGAVAKTSTIALTSVTLPYGLIIAEHGLEEAVKTCPEIACGVNLYKGKVTYNAVAEACNTEFCGLETLIG